MEENNRKGPGVFYAVVGVATLVVAIIGATFAYFSANASNNTAITGATAEAGNLTLEVTPLDTATGGLIPMADSLLNKGVNANCVDSNGNTVCHVYQIKLTNGPSPVTINGSLSFTATAKNVVYNVSHVDQTTAVDLSAISTKVGDSTTGTAYSTAATLDSGVSFNANEAKYYYVVVWLHETGEAQEDDDAGQTAAYTGTVTFNAVGANGVNGVTATFNS